MLSELKGVEKSSKTKEWSLGAALTVSFTKRKANPKSREVVCL